MVIPNRLTGIIPVIPTPFTPDEQLDMAALRRLVEFAIAAGAKAVCLPAYASESYKLDAQERQALIEAAIDQARGRTAVIAQVNYASARQTVEVARATERAGAAFINAAVPRLFAVGERDLFRYFGRLLEAISVPLIIQDFSPSGGTISPQFVADLHRAHSNFQYIKLEEPMMGNKVEAVIERTHGEVGVLEGWGGLYMLELIPAGICAVMPGLAVSDLLNRIWQLALAHRMEEAYDVFQGVVLQIIHSLQSREFFHHAEKLLLADRGLFERPIVRDLGMSLSERESGYIRFLNGRVLELLDRLSMPRNPVSG